MPVQRVDRQVQLRQGQVATLPSWAFALIVITAVACSKKHAGDACSGAVASCVDGANALFCQNGRLAAMPCRGPSGCVRRASDSVDCDNGIAEPGDGCDQPNDAACSTDKKTELLCKDGKFVLAATCKGPHGCNAKDDSVECDNDVSDEGDPCVDEGDAACRTDKAAFLKCTAGRFKVTNSCRGPRGCVLSEKPDEQKTLFECDDSLAQAGDPCEDEGDDACSLDRKALYVCRGHAFAVGKTCRSGKACALDTATGKFDCRPGM